MPADAPPTSAECEEGDERREGGDELRKTKNADRLGSREPAREGGGGVRTRPCARPRHLERDRRLPPLVGKEERLTNREGDPPGLERRKHKAKRNPRPEADLGEGREKGGYA
ncbi:MAG TPA: hypothetical protein VKM54_23385 [Myxococcota bacterium]|nr:hypothetical protein [Myxococcota bacterium]